MQNGKTAEPPVPLTITVARDSEGLVSQLASADRERITAQYPAVKPAPKIFISSTTEKAFHDNFWEPWGEIATLLTGLSEEKRRNLGGVRVVDQQSGDVLWTQEDPFLSIGAAEVNAAIKEWIDAHTTSPADLPAVLHYLTNYTTGTALGPGGGIPHPPVSAYADYLWPWNRSGGQFLEKGLVDEAVAVWAGCYLSLLGVQCHFQLRIHKGMPLCNLGVALQRKNDVPSAVVAWLLGLIEDTLTDSSTVHDQQTYDNLRSVDVPESTLTTFASGIRARFVDRDLLVALPELAFGFGVEPHQPTFNADIFGAVTRLVQRLSQAYPLLPDAGAPFATLAEVWSGLRLPRNLRLGSPS